jgi:manganese efflux pump family protein
VLALLLIASALGLSNFAASVGIGVSGRDTRTRLRVGLAFGVAEAGMPILGLLLGHATAGLLGPATRWVGAGLLAATGGYTLVHARQSRAGAEPFTGATLGRLAVMALALSIDNLAVGFALGTYHVTIVLATLIIGAVSVALSLAGLELGARIGARAGHNGELLGGVILIGVAIAMAAGVL